MDKNEFMKGIKKIQSAYNTKFDAEKLKLWYEQLKTMNADKYINRIEYLIKTNQYIPNIAEVINKKNYEHRDYSNYDFSKLYANL